MSASNSKFRLSSAGKVLVPLVLFAGCLGLRTPLDDASVDDAGRCATTTTVRTTHAIADVLIVLDRSESMRWRLDADAFCASGDVRCSTRLQAIVPAVGAVVTDNPMIHWGLELLPAPNVSECGVSGSPQVAVAANTTAAIKAQLSALTTAYSTPTAAALKVATSYLGKLGDGNNKAILLATDGLPTCGVGAQSWGAEDLDGATAAAAAARKAGFPVYVIGIGPSVSNLDALAVAGGTLSYFPATSVAQLDEALGSIAKFVSSCAFKADKAPANKDLVYVYVDKKLVDQNGDDGWAFDAADPTNATITLTGRYCQDILSGQSSQVQIMFFDCAGSSPPAELP